MALLCRDIVIVAGPGLVLVADVIVGYPNTILKLIHATAPLPPATTPAVPTHFFYILLQI